MSLSEELPQTPDEEPADPEAMAAELGLGIDLSPEEQVEAEKMVAHLKTQFGLVDEEGEDEAEEEPEPEPEPEEAPVEPEVQPEAPTAQDDWISIDGRAVPVAEARSMLELRQYLARNPEKAEAVRRAIEDEAKPEPVETKPPEWLDLDDPSQRFFWEQSQAQTKAISALQQQQATQLQNQARAEALSAVNVAMDTFRRSHPELTEDDVQIVRTHAVALNIIPGLQQGRSGTDAVLKALDIAYLDHPDFRARAEGRPTPAEAKATESKSRKQKLAGLAGSSTAAARQPEPEARPTSDREARQQAAKWLSEQGIL